MKYPAHIYAKALAEVIMATQGKGSDNIRKSFLELLRSYGDDAHLQKILEETERFLREKDGTKKISVHVARSQKRPVRELVQHIAGPHDVIEEKIDPSLIAGAKVIVNDERVFDGSLKRKLDVLFSI